MDPSFDQMAIGSICRHHHLMMQKTFLESWGRSVITRESATATSRIPIIEKKRFSGRNVAVSGA
eukprot:scaffold9639_cov84-Cylindrotheca_fusiformis.AAC.2